MSIEENKDLVRRFIEEVFNANNAEAIADFCVPGSLFAGGYAGQMKVMKTAFPDMQFTIDELVAEADTVVAVLTSRGTHNGPLAGMPAFGKLEEPIPPSGAYVVGTSISVYKMKDGRIMSMLTELDQVGLMRQLGWTFAPPDPEVP